MGGFLICYTLDMTEPITVSVLVSVPVEEAWEHFTDPDEIIKWNAASDDWHTVRAENDLRPGGSFSYRMEAKDGSEGFDLTGTYEEVALHEHLTYVLDDGRKVAVSFVRADDGTAIAETFDPENENPLEMQRAGWQAILDRFKAYVESAS